MNSRTTPPRKLSPELVGILSSGVALAALIITVWTVLHNDLNGLRGDVREDLTALRSDVREDIAALRADLRGLDDRLRAVETRLYAVETTTGTTKTDEPVSLPGRGDKESVGRDGSQIS